ncbi:MAG: translocation/assembly module TamB domain-containing protein [Bacteroidetes Order II. Incertae sedis bacterium]|nr:translocation/assembly module TamB domain-containing protein [Bacteroidetes Order II. bacterium]
MELVEPAQNPTPPPKKRTRWLRWLLWRPLLFVLILFWFLASTWGTLQTRWGSDQFRRFVVAQLNEQLNGTLEIGHVDGSYWRNIRATNLVIWQKGEAIVRIKEVRAAYTPLDILGGTLHITDLQVLRPELVGRQLADSTWNLLGLLKSQPETGASSQQTILVDHLRILDGNGKLVVLTNPLSTKPPHEQPEVERTATYQGLRFEARNLIYKAPGLTGDVQDLQLTSRLPSRKDDLEMQFSGKITESSAHIRSFKLSSAFSKVSAEGYVALPRKDGHNFSNFQLKAAPFAFKEIAPFAPFLDPEEILESDIRVSAPNGTWRAETQGQFKRAGTWDLVAVTDFRTPAQIALTGEIGQLNLAYLTAQASYASNLTGRIQAQLSGSSLQALNGAYALTLEDGGRWQQYMLRKINLKGSAHDGKMAFQLQGGIGDAALDINGTARPFDVLPVYDLSGRVTQFTPAYLNPAFNYGTFGGQFELRGQGIDPDLATLSGQLKLMPTEFHYSPYQLPIRQTQIGFSYDKGTGKFDFSSEVGSGFIAAQGGIVLGEQLEYYIKNGSIRHLNVREFIGNEIPPGDINTRFSLQGTGGDTNDLRLTIQAEVQPSRFDIYNIRSGNLTASLSNGTLRYQTNATIGESHLSLAGIGKPFDRVPVFTISEGAFTNLNLDDFVLDQSLDTHLNGRFTANVTGTTPKTMTISSAFTLGPSQFRAYQIEGLRGNITLVQNLLRYDVDFRSAFGNAILKGRAQPFSQPLMAQVEEGRFSAVNLAAITGQANLQSHLNGAITEGQFTASDEQNFAGQLLLRLEESRFNCETVRSGFLELKGNTQQLDYRLQINPDSGGITLAGTGGLKENEPFYQVKGNLVNISLAKWLNLPDTVETRINVDLDLAGRGITAETMQLQGLISLKNSHWDTLLLSSAWGNFQYLDGTLQLDSLLVHSNLGTFSGQGPLAVYDNLMGTESDMQFSGYIKTLAPLSGLAAAQLTGRGQIRGSIRGQINAWRIRFDTVDDGLTILSYDDLHIGKARGRATVEYESGVPIFQTRAELENISVPGYVLEGATLEAGLRDSVVTFGGKFKLDERLSGNGNGAFTLLPHGQQLDLETIRMELGGKRWQIERPTQIFWNQERLFFNDFLLIADDQRIAAKGGLARDGTGVLNAVVERVDVAAIANILKFPALGGVLSGKLEISGTLDAPLMHGDLGLERITSSGKPVGGAIGQLIYKDRRLSLNLGLSHIEGQNLSLSGFLPFNLGQLSKPLVGPVDLRLKTERFNLDWANPFMDESFMRDIKGRVSGDMTIGGTFDTPDFRGALSVRNTQFYLPFLGIQYNEAEADLVFGGDVAQVQNLSVRTGKGGLKGTGTISLSKLNLGYLDLALEADGFQMIRDNTFRVTGTGKASLKGTTTRPVLDGDVVLNECDVQLNAELMQSARETIQLSEEDLREVEARFGKQANIADTSTVTFYDATDVKLRVRSNGNSWLRSRYNPRMDIEMTGDLEFRKPYRSPEVVVGRLKAVPGRSRVEFGRRFDLTAGDILFNGDMLNPVLNISATYKAGAGGWGDDQAISMEISGDVNNTNFRFSSNPPMEDTEILSYLAFGRPAQSAFSLDNGIVGDLLSTYGYNLVESLLSQRVQESGLADVVELTSANGEPSLKIGKYISRRFFIALDSKILGGTGGSGFLLEYQAQKWALLRIQQFPSTDDLQDRTLGLYVLLEYAY